MYYGALMGKVIVVSGKGGTGKTSVSASLINYITEHNGKSILAIDADPDTNLPQSLGESVKKTIGDVREELQKERDKLAATTDKQRLLEYKVMGILQEGEKIDLLAMGRPEGPDCYCWVNHQLRIIIDTLSKNYDICIIDAEAGLEHLSRRTIRDVDTMLIVTDATKKGLDTAKRIKDLSEGLQIKFKDFFVIANKVKEKDKEKIEKLAADLGLSIVGMIPYDQNVAESDLEGKPIVELPKNSPFFQVIDEVAAKLGL